MHSDSDAVGCSQIIFRLKLLPMSSSSAFAAVLSLDYRNSKITASFVTAANEPALASFIWHANRAMHFDFH